MIKYLFNKFFIVDQDLVIDADFIQETGSPDSLVQMKENIRDVLHQDVFGFHVVETEQGQVLVNREEESTMDFEIDGVFAHEFDIVYQGNVNAFSHVEFLEEAVVALSFVVEVVYDFLVEDFFFNVHQRLDVLQRHVVLQSPCQKEQVLNYARSL